MINFIKEDDHGQMKIGHISENSAIVNLIHLHNLHDSHKDLLKSAQEQLDHHKNTHLSSDDAEDRDEHGRMIAHAISNHISSAYPGFNLKEIHHANYKSTAEITNGLHNDSRVDNPSDIIVKLQHPETGEEVYHGYSLKSTRKKGGHIGFKNPTPKTMDVHLGTNRESLHKQALEELFSNYPYLRKLPNKAKDDGPSRKTEINNNSPIKDDVKRISQHHFSKIAKHTVDHLNQMLTTDEGHDRLKQHLKKYYMNSTSSMPYAKVTASGTKKSGMAVELEDTQNSNVTRLLNHPKSKMRVRHSGNYIKYDIHDPDTNTWHGVANEQVKTSSGFGYSSPRHNIHPPDLQVPQN
jgi:hypothetical protein